MESMVTINKTTTLEKALKEASILGAFKKFCNIYNNVDKKTKLRNILNKSCDINSTIEIIFKNEVGFDIEAGEINRMYELIEAFLRKSSYRQRISESIKKELIIKQGYKCAICGKPIDVKAHADHIVPFIYVGDELNNNLQMLCSHCNESKNKSIDYQIRFLLNLVK